MLVLFRMWCRPIISGATSYVTRAREDHCRAFSCGREEGLCLGGSSAINVAGAIRVARDMGVAGVCSEYRHYPGSNGPGSEKPSIDSTFA